MVRTVTAREAEVGFRDVLQRLLADGEPVVVEDAGEALAVVISPAEYRAFRRSRDPWAVIDEIRERNADKDPDEVLHDVTQIVEEVRQERYERRRRAAEGGR